MRFKIGTLEIPSDLTASLTIDGDNGIAKANDALSAASSGTADARERLDVSRRLVARLPADVEAGRAPAAALDDALRAVDAGRLRIEAADAKERSAQDAVARALELAHASLLDRATKRRDEMQAIADRLEPLLEALRNAAIAIDDTLRAATAGSLDRAGRPVQLVVNALTWSPCLRDMSEIRIVAAGRENALAKVRELESK